MNMTSKVPSKLNLATIIILTTLANYANAEGEQFEFNDGFIVGEHNKVDLSKYTSKELTEGVYSLDVYVNDEWKGRHDILVEKQINGKMGICYTREMLTQYGLSPEKINKSLSDKKDFCGVLKEWDDSESVIGGINKDSLRLDIKSPQIFQDRLVRNYVDPSFWNYGIGALNLGWNGTIWNSHYSQSKDNTSGYIGVNTTATFDGWGLIHRGNLSWEDKFKGKWNSNQTYLQKPIPKMSSTVSIGQVSSTGNLLDTISIRGVSLKTDERMLPDGMNSFAPEIRGIAKSNALVTVKQSDSIIYQTTVPPGPFVLEDIYPYGYGNNLEVSVKESDGTIETFTVPYNSGVKLLRPGNNRYEVSIGKPDIDYYHNKPMVYQGTFQYGINNLITAQTGVSGFDNYQSYLFGLGLNTPIGGVSLDTTVSHLKTNKEDAKGQMYRFSFSRNFENSGTNLSFNMMKYSDSNFYNLSDALYVNDSSSNVIFREKSEYNLYISQQLAENWGNLFANGRLVEYANDRKEIQYQLNYNNSFGNLNWSVTAQRAKTVYSHYSNKNNDSVSINFNYPLSFGEKNRATLTSNTIVNNSGGNSTQVGVNGSLGEDNDFNYGVNTRVGKESKNLTLNSGYRSTWADLNGSYSQGTHYRQNSFGASGTILVHDEGITLSSEKGNTLALVKAENAQGARVSSGLGGVVDSNGFAIISSLRPYRVNTVTLDPKGTSDKLHIAETSKQIVPVEGSVVKINFNTEIQDNIYLRGKLTNGNPLPFGATIFNQANKEIGVVGQGSVVYIKDASSKNAIVKWENGSCKFNIPNDTGDVTCI